MLHHTTTAFGWIGWLHSFFRRFGLCSLTTAAILFASTSFGQATPTPSGTPYVTNVSFGTVVSGTTGYYGMEITVRRTPVVVNALGRFVLPGNSGSHTLKLVDASTGLDIPGGSVTIETAGAATNTYLYGTLPSPITLAAGGVYYFVSSETSGGDQWYAADSVDTVTNDAFINDSVEYAGSSYSLDENGTNHSYGPLNFTYVATPTPNGLPYVTDVSFGTVLNDVTDATGYGGMEITVGSTPMSVNALGRFVLPGNSGSHTLKLVDANTGLDIPGGSVTIETAGAATNTYLYGTLPSPVILDAGGVYYIVSSETSAGDQFYAADSVATTTSDAMIDNSAYSVENDYALDAWGTNHSYGPLNFTYSLVTPTPSGTPYVMGVSFGTVLSDATGYGGMEITVGSTPMIVTALGRFVLPGSSDTHTLKLVDANTGLDIPGGSVTIETAGAATNTYLYGTLPSPITLAAGGVYYFLSSETSAGDQFYAADSVATTTTDAMIDNSVYSVEDGYGFDSWGTNHSYGPLNFTYSLAVSPIVTWLISNGFASNADLQSDPNNDGVSLLMDYALNLDPTKNQRANMPMPVLTANQMSLTFYAGRAGVTYTVETSSDLQTWTTTGVTVSAPDANNFSTATVPMTGDRVFLRVKVSY